MWYIGKAVNMNYVYKKFDDYLNEIEGYGCRGERLSWEFDELSIEKRKRLVEWLQAAFECGRMCETLNDNEDIVYRLRKRSEIRRQIPDRKSVQEGKEDRIARLLDEAADEIERLRHGRE